MRTETVRRIWSVLTQSSDYFLSALVAIKGDVLLKVCQSASARFRATYRLITSAARKLLAAHRAVFCNPCRITSTFARAMHFGLAVVLGGEVSKTHSALWANSRGFLHRSAL